LTAPAAVAAGFGLAVLALGAAWFRRRGR
jgi:hypothetical protein